MMLCCASAICSDCDVQRKNKAGTSKSLNKCLLCRTPLPVLKNGQAFFRDGESEFEKYKKWSRKGKGFASYMIGKIYTEGAPDCKQDFFKAFEYFKLASEQGNDKAMTDLGVCLIQGEGCKADFKKAKTWFEIAARKENAKAMCYLAYFLADPQFGFIVDFRKAQSLLLRSATLGFPPAQERIGLGYWKAEYGYPKDLDRAADYLQQAADQGEVSSMLALAQVLLEKAEVEHGSLNVMGESPMPRAINWMRRAGRLGDSEADRRAKVTVDFFMKKNCMNCGAVSADCGGTAKLRHCAKCKVVFYVSIYFRTCCGQH